MSSRTIAWHQRPITSRIESANQPPQRRPDAKGLTQPAEFEIAPPAVPQKALFASVLQSFAQVLARAQRPLTPEDHARARENPVCWRKKSSDYATVGSEALLRRGTRYRRAGKLWRANALRAAGVVALLPTFAVLPNMLCYYGRLSVEAIAGAPFVRARSEGGVREDVVLEALHDLKVMLDAKVDWIFADRGPNTTQISQQDLRRVMDAATAAQVGLQAYIAQYPDIRVRHSEALRAALRQIGYAMPDFQGRLRAISKGTETPPWPLPQPHLAPPRPRQRNWGIIDLVAYRFSC